MDDAAPTKTMDGVAGPSLEDELAILGSIARFQIRGVVGSGGEGVVLAAHDTELGRPVAIKVLLRDAEEAHARTMREAQALAQLSHPNVVTVHEVLRIGQRTGIVMALIDGCDLVKWRKPEHTWRDIVGVYLQAARGLAAAHRAGLVHRDFKPSNALIDADGVVRVSDFGLARPPGERLAGTVGTPAYMAPEQKSGDPVDARADQYSFAVALFEALAGRRPESSSKTQAPPPGPRWLRMIVLRALASGPSDRFPSMTAVVAALENGLARRRQWAFAVAAGAVVVTCAAVWFAFAARDSATQDDKATPQWVPVTIATETGNSPVIDFTVSRDGTTLARASATDITVEPRLGGRTKAHTDSRGDRPDQRDQAVRDW